MECLPSVFREVAPQLHPSLASDVANLYHEIRALRPEVVHAWLDWSNVRAGLAAVLAGVPKVILSGRNLNPTHFAFSTDYFHPVYKALAQYGAGRVTILNNSQAGADDYADWLSVPPESVKVLRNGVQFTDDMRPSADHKSAFRARHGIPQDALLIGGMFRFYPEKQPLLWLETAAKISQAVPDAHFIVFGQGVMREHMEKRIQELGIAARTHLCEVITPSLDGLSPCDLVMLTSSGEGTPNVLLEAQWLGVPVVTTAAGGAGEAVLDGVTGVVVHQKDADAIAGAALAILRNREFRNAVRQEGPAFISSRYGMDRMIKETLAVYQLDKSV